MYVTRKANIITITLDDDNAEVITEAKLEAWCANEIDGYQKDVIRNHVARLSDEGRAAFVAALEADGKAAAAIEAK